MTGRKQAGGLLAASAITLVATSAAHAQQAAGPDRPGADPAVLNEIVVTATKRSVRLQDVPVSVQVVSREQLQSSGTISTASLPNLTPGMYFAPSVSPKTAEFGIRGVGTFAVTDALEPSVGVAVDGVPVARVSGAVFDMVDIDHIEVLKGPQGTLFGKNATAGVISIVTRRPQLGVTSLEGNISYGSFKEANIDLAQNIALGDTAAIRLTGWRVGHEGFVTGVTNGKLYGDQNSYGFRVGLAFVPTDRFNYTLTAQYDGRNDNGNVVTASRFVAATPPPIVASAAAHGIVAGPNNRRAEFNAAPFDKANNWYVTGVGDYRFGQGYTLTSVTSYRRINLNNQFDSFGTSSPIFNLSQLADPERYFTFSQELRVASPTDQRLSYVAGLFYYHFNVTDTLFETINGVPVAGVSRASIINPSSVKMTDYAVFGEATFHVTPALRLIAGLRQSHDDLNGSYVRFYASPPVGPTFPAVQPASYVSPNYKYDFTSYRAGVQYDVRPGLMTYFTASRGYKAPGFNFTPSLTQSLINSFGASVDAETAQSYELGLKGQFFDRKLSVNVALYNSTYDNFQTTVTVQAVPVLLAIQNAKQLRTRGIEWDISAIVAPGLTVGMNGAYSDAKYTDYKTAPCYQGQPSLPAGSALIPGYCVGGRQNLDGVVLPQAPMWQLNANLNYERQLSDNWKGFATAEVQYRGRASFDPSNDPLAYQSGYAAVNATLGIGPSNGRWRASFYARNLFDKFFTTRLRQFTGYYQQYIPYEANRRVGVQLHFQY